MPLLVVVLDVIDASYKALPQIAGYGEIVAIDLIPELFEDGSLRPVVELDP